MFKKIAYALCLLAFMTLAGGCGFDTPEEEITYIGAPGGDYTRHRAKYSIRQNKVYIRKELTRILLLDRPSMVHEDFVDY